MTSRTHTVVLAALFAALTAAGAFLHIPLGVTQVSLQFLFTALAGVLLGPKWGSASQAVYVALGLAGLPVFTQGGGLGYLAQPTMGFLLGLIPCAWVIGRLGGGSGSAGRTALACLAGLAVLYLIGVPYLWAVMNLYLGAGMTVRTAVRVGMLLYLPGDCLKIAVTAAVGPALTRALRRR